AVFAEPDRTSPANVLPIWSTTSDIDDKLKQELAALPDNDKIFARVVQQAGNVVTGFALIQDNNGHVPLQRGNFAFGGDDPHQFLVAHGGAVTNLPEIEQAAAGNGAFSFEPDSDFVIRRVPLVQRLNDRLYPLLALEALRVALGAKTMVIKSSGANQQTAYGEHTGINNIKLGPDWIIPTDSRGQLLMHFTREVPQRTIAAWKVMAPNFDPAEVRDKIIFVGTSAAGLKDIRPSPIDPGMPGVEAHAQAAEQILLHHFLLRPDWADGAEAVFMLVLGIILIILLRSTGALWSAAVGAVSIAGLFGASWYAYKSLLLLVDPVMPSLTAVAIYMSGTLIGYLRTEAEKRFVRGAMGQYMSPALVEQIANDPSRLKLGGELREMTFLFCDVRGFTTISETFKSNPQGLTHLINKFLTPMTDLILARRGTIDKYMGDCIMAFWNAPLDDPEHADHACESALAMIHELKDLNVRLKQEAEAEDRRYHPLNIGIGLNTGECVVGNMGSDQRFDYSVLGDAVNLASRLEGQSKNYGVGIVIGESTRAAAPSWAAIELDLIAVKGKKEAVRIFTLHGDQALAQTDEFRSLNERHDAMLACYRQQEWNRAKQLIVECRQLDGRLEHLYDLYDERVAYYTDNPPGPDWDGVFVATSK
ncbi:MAG TPA: adenylate/guanylate cyclase domain-containing protein, partial [Candidatus Sulfotelmatobacter sp.]|nr:adenylate/guanylate cyclase domain-containing protein [Candidatus Sulfotelmatobacter sp.]